MISARDAEFQRNNDMHAPDKTRTKSLKILDYKPVLPNYPKEMAPSTSRSRVTDMVNLEKENLNKSNLSFHTNNKSELRFEDLGGYRHKPYRNSSLNTAGFTDKILPENALNFKVLKFEEEKSDFNRAEDKLRRDQISVEKQLNLIERKLAEISDFKEKLDASYNRKNEALRTREIFLDQKEADLDREKSIFRQEKHQ